MATQRGHSTRPTSLRAGRGPSTFVPPSFLPPNPDSRARGGDCQLSAPRTSNFAEFDLSTTLHRDFLPRRKSLRAKALE